jgi:DNA helicase-2/ATP-dependent DNA helicase PcrA
VACASTRTTRGRSPRCGAGTAGNWAPSGDLSAKHPNVVRLKKQLGILKAVEAYVARQTRTVEAWLAGKLAPYDLQGTWLASIHGSTAPVAQRLIRAREAALARRAETTEPAAVARLTQIHAVLAHAVSRLIGYKDELLSILTDRELLAAHLPQASAVEIDELVAYQTALQRRAAGDRHAGPTVDFEDLAILLRLMQLKHGGLPNAKQDETVDLYEHVLIDEAQDFGAVELTATLGAVRSRTGVTIVGDANQKIIPEADFMGWDALARELGVGGATVARLEVPHRSTAPIMALADALVGDAPQAGRAGLTPRLSVVPPEGQIDRLASAVRGFLAERPNAHVAVVCGRAREVDAVLGEVSARLRGDGLSVRVGQREAFSFSPGVTVTNLRQIKGLEFDAVFALDVNDDRYPSDDQGRRWLYTLDHAREGRGASVQHRGAGDAVAACHRLRVSSPSTRPKTSPSSTRRVIPTNRSERGAPQNPMRGPRSSRRPRSAASARSASAKASGVGAVPTSANCRRAALTSPADTPVSVPSRTRETRRG